MHVTSSLQTRTIRTGPTHNGEKIIGRGGGQLVWYWGGRENVRGLFNYFCTNKFPHTTYMIFRGIPLSPGV